MPAVGSTAALPLFAAASTICDRVKEIRARVKAADKNQMSGIAEFAA